MEPDSDPSNFSEIPLADHSGEELLRLWKAGDEQAAGVLVDRYVLRLVSLVVSRMNQRFRGSIDPEDVVQSAMGSFFNAAHQDRIQISNSVSLWRLLATFARRKLARSVEKQTAFKRGGDHTRLSLVLAEPNSQIDSGGREEEAVQELADALTAELPQGLRDVLAGLLAGTSQKEIAESLAIDERTVRRRVVRLRQDLALELLRVDARPQSEFSSDVLRRIGYHEFVLAKLIGSGGFGKVYRAWMQSEEATVAVKFLRKAFWKIEQARQTFLREIEAASQIDHPGVARYLGWGQSPHGGPYVVSQWIDGETLEQFRSVNPERFVEFLQQILAALSAVHDAGLVHGDLTPSNILIDRAGQLTLTDFGFSQAQRPQATSRLSGGASESPLGGTLGFAAPEQFSSAFGMIGPKTDIYAVGGLAYWYLTGQAPHHADQVAQAIANTISPEEVAVPAPDPKSGAVSAITRLAAASLRKPVAHRPPSTGQLSGLIDAGHKKASRTS